MLSLRQVSPFRLVASLPRHSCALAVASLLASGGLFPSMVQASMAEDSRVNPAVVNPAAVEPGAVTVAVLDPVDPPVETKVVLVLSRREISVMRDGQRFGPWPVAIGDPRTPTPTGVYQVQNMQVNPKYQSTKTGKVNSTTGVKSPLGDRWIGFLQNGPNQFGIHGTPWPHWVNVRGAVSNGCVRMLHAHVRQLYDMVDVGTPVEIRR